MKAGGAIVLWARGKGYQACKKAGGALSSVRHARKQVERIASGMTERISGMEESRWSSMMERVSGMMERVSGMMERVVGVLASAYLAQKPAASTPT